MRLKATQPTNHPNLPPPTPVTGWEGGIDSFTISEVIMGIIAEVASKRNGLHPDQLFERSQDKVLINELNQSPEERTMAISRLMTTVDGNELSPIPVCQCGYLKDYLGVGATHDACPRCHTKASSPLLKEIAPVVFINRPPHIKSLLQMIFLIHFKVAYSKKSFDTLLYFLDTTYQGKDPKIEELNLPRGYNNFVDNLELIMETLNSTQPFKKKAAAIDLLELYRKSKDDIHCNYLYLINKSLFVIDKSPLMTRLQPPLVSLMDISLSLIGLNHKKLSPQQISNRFGRIMRKLVKFYEDYFREILSKKTGAIRTQLYNVRATVSSYCVITSITTNLQHPDEVHLAYSPTLHMLYPQVLGQLLKEGMPYHDATSYIHQYTHISNPHLHAILENLLKVDSPERTHMLMQRFPTLWRGNMLKAPVYKVKPDASDKSTSVSILASKQSNSDFDGDKMVGSPCPPYPEFNNLGSKYSMLDLGKIREISSNLSLTPPTITNLIAFREHRQTKPCSSPVDVFALYGVD